MTMASRRQAPARRGAAVHHPLLLVLAAVAALARPAASHPAVALQGAFAGPPGGASIGAGAAAAGAEAAAAPTPTHRFFHRLDANRDGQLEADELAHHITRALGDAAADDDLIRTAGPGGGDPASSEAAAAGAGAAAGGPKTGPPRDAVPPQGGGGGGGAAGGPQYLTREQVLSAVQQAVDSVDGADAGSTISLAELERHLSRAVLRGIRVSDWVAHGLSLPRYRGAFLTHGVTPLDFPYLVEGGGDLLAAELGVTSKLHQQRILRAMQRQMLALGREPSPPSGLTCRAAGGGGAAAGAGEAAAGPLRVALSWRPPEDPGQPHFHSYQLQRLAVHGVGAGRGGGGGGAGGWATVGEIDAEAAPAAVVDRVPSEGVYRYRVAAWNLHGRSTWLASGDCAVGAWGGAGFPAAGGGGGEGARVGGAVGGALQQPQEHAQALAAAPSRALAVVGPVSGGPPVWADPVHWPAAQTGGGAGGHNAATPAGAALLTANLMSGGAQGLGAAGAPAPGSAPRSPAPAAPAAVAAAAATARLGRWLWALANSLLLVFIPLCVRLLPLPLLSRAQRALVRMLLLPLGRGGRSGAGPGQDAAAALQDDSPGVPSPPVVGPQPLSRPASSGRDAVGGSSGSSGGIGRPRPAGTSVGAAMSAAAAGDIGGVAAAGGAPHPVPPDESPQQRALRLLLEGSGGGRSSSPAPAAPRGMPRSGSEGRLAAIGGGRALSFQDLSFASAYATSLEQTDAAQRGRSSPVLGRPPGANAYGSGPGSDGEDWEDLGAGSGGGFAAAAAAEAAAAAPPAAGRVDKRRCAAPGCGQRFEVRNLRAMWERHYCGRCQRAFCLAHTAYSTHGPGGQCGADSGCCCFACFAEFTPAHRAELSARNTLRHRQRSLSGGPAVAGAHRGGGGWPERGTPRQQAAPPPRRRSVGGTGQPQPLPQQQQHSGATQVSGRSDSPPSQQQQQQQQPQNEEQTSTSPSNSRARALWRRGWAKLKARGGPASAAGPSSGGS